LIGYDINRGDSLAVFHGIRPKLVQTCTNIFEFFGIRQSLIGLQLKADFLARISEVAKLFIQRSHKYQNFDISCMAPDKIPSFQFLKVEELLDLFYGTDD
jgi:hypothetical protein